MKAFLNRDSGLDVAIAVIEKYIRLFSDECVPTQFAIPESEIRRLFCEPWITADAEIPERLTEGEEPSW